MCLILFCCKPNPKTRFVLAANRDEFLDRETRPLGYNFPGEMILGGQDLRGGGTWLGANGEGKLAAVTNYRDPGRNSATAVSRGELVMNYLRSGLSPSEFLLETERRGLCYNGYNLLLVDGQTVVHYSNISRRETLLRPGLYGLSNHLLDTPWPKVTRGKMLLKEALTEENGLQGRLFGLLRDGELPGENELPDTGVGIRWEKILSPLFIHSPGYGTRSSAVVVIDNDGNVSFSEQNYLHGTDGVRLGEFREYCLLARG